MEAISLPSIALIVYWVVEILKYVLHNNEKFSRLIPVLAVVLGAVFGIVAFYAAPQIMPATDLFSAIIIGGASGMSATGVNQIYKQLSKYKTEDSGNGNGNNINNNISGNGKSNDNSKSNGSGNGNNNNISKSNGNKSSSANGKEKE